MWFCISNAVCYGNAELLDFCLPAGAAATIAIKLNPIAIHAHPGVRNGQRKGKNAKAM